MLGRYLHLLFLIVLVPSNTMGFWLSSPHHHSVNLNRLDRCPGRSTNNASCFPHQYTSLEMSASSTSKNNKNQKKPTFAQAAFTKNNQKQQRRGGGGSGGDGAIGIKHQERIKNAGRVGTKRYVNPCKVFLGNLPFSVSEPELTEWLCNQMGMPSGLLLNQIKIIRDWKTGKSKGYGFAVFTEAIYATVCIDKCNYQDFHGRKLSVNQGRKKPDASGTEYYVQKKLKKAKDAQEEAIQAGIQEAEAEEEEVELLDPEEFSILRRLDPDLVDGYANDDNVDGLLFGEEGDDDDDDDDGVDGIWLGDDKEFAEDGGDEGDQNMNRKQRREAARGKKRRKLPHKGFERPK